MKATLFDSTADFQARVWPFLLQHEAENNLMIGLTSRLAGGDDGFLVPGQFPLLCIVEDAGKVIAAALMTPPHRIILTRGPGAAIDLLARHLHEKGVCPPGVLGPSESVSVFADAWTHVTDQSAQDRRGLRIYQLDRVLPGQRTPGRLEPAVQTDLDLALEWMRGFCTDVETLPPTPDQLRERIDRGDLFLWKAPEPVSMAAIAGPTPGGIRISTVYTPPAFRNRGYASALVAALSQRQLDAGRKFCFLFTDLANPTSNSIYQKIGYRPVCNFEELDFAPLGHMTGV